MSITRWPFIRWKSESASNAAIGGIALTVTTLSGATFNGFAKKLTSALSPLSLLFLSEVLTAFFVLFSFGVLPTIKSILHLNRKELFWVTIVGALTGVIGPFLLFAGLTYTTAINAGLFGNMQMVFMVVLAHFILKEKMTSAHYSASFTILAGTVIISLKGFTDGLTLQFGDALIIASGLAYAYGSIYYRKFLFHVEPHIALFSRSIIAIVTFFIVSPFVPHPFIAEMHALPSSLIPTLIGFAFIARFLNSVTFYESIKRLDVTTVSLVGSLGVIASTLFAYLYLGEPIAWYHFVGGAFIILGTVLLELLGAHPTSEHLEKHLKVKM